MVRPQDYGLIYVKGEFKYFTAYKIITEKHGDKRLKATLADGRTVTVHKYYNKKKGRFIEAEEAIHRYPSQIITTEEANDII